MTVFTVLQFEVEKMDVDNKFQGNGNTLEVTYFVMIHNL